MKKTHLKLFLFAVIVVSIIINPLVYANNDYYSNNNIRYYNDGCDSDSGSVISAGASGENKDYRGEKIFTDAEIERIKESQPLYEKAVEGSSTPWQLLAVVHKRESGLSKQNPGNGQGLFQDSHYRHPELYTPGLVVDDDNFIKQAKVAIDLMENGKLPGGNSQTGLNKTTDDLKNKDPDAIKMILTGYNGFASVYKTQAERLGFTHIMDGSPYTMNRADEKRDPTVEPTKSNGTWGQIKRDYGGIEYPANTDHGAYVMFTALAGLPSGRSDDCGTGGVPGEPIFFGQGSPPWGQQEFACETYAAAACGATSAAMVVSTLKGREITPPEVVKANRDNISKYGEAEVCGSGSILDVWASTLEGEFGLRYESRMNGEDRVALKDWVDSSLDKGAAIIMNGIDGPKPWISGVGHYAVVFRKLPNDKYLVGDPNTSVNENAKIEVDTSIMINYSRSNRVSVAFYAN